MKIIALKGNYGTDTATMPEIYVMADSALQKSGRPLFIPGWAERFGSREHLVLRVGRLGKNIASRFAMRYIDAVTVGFAVQAYGINGGVGEDSPIATSWDGAALVGEFVDINQVDINEIEIATYNKGALMHTIHSSEMSVKVPQIVEYVSRYFTLKNGDLIFTGSAFEPEMLSIDDRLTATLNGVEVLNNKIK